VSYRIPNRIGGEKEWGHNKMTNEKFKKGLNMETFELRGEGGF
jgi:hypothetical protein